MNATLRPYFQPAFLVCVLLLATAASTQSLIIRYAGWHLTKLPLPLQKPLQEMEEQHLLPYVVRHKSRIDNPDIVETLGTEDYLQWVIEDPAADPHSPTRFCSIFVTYYTGNPDMVPHVPDECYVGGGNERKAGYVDTALLHRNNGKPEEKIAYQNVLFGTSADSAAATDVSFYVAYLFRANGQYSGSRTETRAILGSNFTSKYSYFSKVEWQFYGTDAFGRVFPNRQQVVAASEPLLNILLPVLEQSHWPDWDAANRQDKAAK